MVVQMAECQFASGTGNVMAVLYLGFVLPQDRFRDFQADEPGLRAQTQQFGHGLLEALRANGITCRIFSAAPASNYPQNPHLLFRHGTFTDEDGWDEIGYLNLEGIKHATRFVSLCRWALPRGGQLQYQATIVHGAHSAFIWFAVILTRFLEVPSVVVLTDFPSLGTRSDGLGRRALKAIDRFLVVRGLSMVSGVVALTSELASDLVPPRTPRLVLEGFGPQWPSSSDKTESTESVPMVLYAGGLSRAYGIDLLMQAHELSKLRFKLVIAGAGELAEEIAAAASDKIDIEFLGLVPQSELVDVYREARVVVNPRPPHQDFTKYSFPSKLLEYLASGATVVTTRLPGIPAEYNQHLLYTRPEPTAIAEAIREALTESRQSTEARNARITFATQSRGTRAQGERIRAFLVALQPASSSFGPRRRAAGKLSNLASLARRTFGLMHKPSQ